MKLKDQLMESAFCHPQGIVGHFGGWLMALDRRLPAWVLGLLEVAPSDVVLEVGCGPGVGVEMAAALVPEGRVVGVDPSETMLGMARARNRKGLEAGQIGFHRCTAADLPFGDATFDVALTINSLHLWPDSVAGLREVRRTLRPGGRVGVAFSCFSPVYGSTHKFWDHLIEAGFTDVGVHRGEGGTCAIART
jgi:ubiquinone/menaquinone biosynthesis C-methylase UbiE